MSDVLHKMAVNVRSVLEQRKSKRHHVKDEYDPKTQAMAVMLVEMALIDQDFHQKEYEFIFTFFEQNFGLEDGDIRELIHKATSLIVNYRSTRSFSMYLRESLERPEREELLAAIDQLIKADQREDGFELFMRERFVELLGLGEEESESAEAGEGIEDDEEGGA